MNEITRAAAELAPAIRKLYNAGVTAIYGSTMSGKPEVHLTRELFREAFPDETHIHFRNSREYPYELSTEVDGVRFFCLLREAL